MTIIRIIGVLALLLLPCAIADSKAQVDQPRPHDTRESPHDGFVRCKKQGVRGIAEINRCMLRDWH